jgi:tRNA pseudouridine38-40 synthase
MKNYKMILQYDGTRYDGWQKQGNTANTIQQKLETLLSDLVKHSVEVFGSGRTDTGVHAYGQVANARLLWDKSEEELLWAINDRLPEDIAVLHVEEVPLRFHSRLNARSKRYCYRIWNSRRPPVFQRKTVFWCKEALDVEKMREASSCFLGRHDFKNFSSAKGKKSTVRTIYNIDILQQEEEIQISFHGDGFLYHMVRILTGTLIEVGEGNRTIESIAKVFQEGTRQDAGFTAPAKGLALMEVFYE